LHRLPHQAQLAVLEVPHATVDHPARRGRRPGCEIAAFDERDVDAVDGEFAEHRDAVDAPADDQHTGRRALKQLADVRPHALGRHPSSAIAIQASLPDPRSDRLTLHQGGLEWVCSIPRRG
jgi:hypothetical protein